MTKAVDRITAIRNAKVTSCYLAGATYRELASKFGVSEEAIYKIIRCAGVIQGRRRGGWSRLTERNAKIVHLYLEGARHKQIAKEIQVSESTVERAIHKAGAAQGRKGGSVVNPAITERNAVIVSRYLEGAKRELIAQENGITRAAVTALLSRAGITRGLTRGRSPDPNIAIRNGEMVDRYLQGAKQKDIAQEFGVSKSLLSIVISKAGVAQGRMGGAEPDPMIAERNARIAQQIVAGRTNASIAREEGVTGERIRWIRSRLCLPPAKVGRPKNQVISGEESRAQRGQMGGSQQSNEPNTRKPYGNHCEVDHTSGTPIPIRSPKRLTGKD